MRCNVRSEQVDQRTPLNIPVSIQKITVAFQVPPVDDQPLDFRWLSVERLAGLAARTAGQPAHAGHAGADRAGRNRTLARVMESNHMMQNEREMGRGRGRDF